MGPSGPNTFAANPGVGIGLADPDDPFIGVNLHDEIILCRRAGGNIVIGDEQDMAVDFCDLHVRFDWRVGRRLVERQPSFDGLRGTSPKTQVLRRKQQRVLRQIVRSHQTKIDEALGGYTGGKQGAKPGRGSRISPPRDEDLIMARPAVVIKPSARVLSEPR